MSLCCNVGYLGCHCSISCTGDYRGISGSMTLGKDLQWVVDKQPACSKCNSDSFTSAPVEKQHKTEHIGKGESVSIFSADPQLHRAVYVEAHGESSFVDVEMTWGAISEENTPNYIACYSKNVDKIPHDISKPQGCILNE